MRKYCLYCKSRNTIYKHLLKYWGAFWKTIFSLCNPNIPDPQHNNIPVRRCQENVHGLKVPFSGPTFSSMAGIDFHYIYVVFKAGLLLLFSRLVSSSNLNRISKHHPCPLSERWTEIVMKNRILRLRISENVRKVFEHSIANCILNTPGSCTQQKRLNYYYMLFDF